MVSFGDLAFVRNSEVPGRQELNVGKTFYKDLSFSIMAGAMPTSFPGSSPSRREREGEDPGNEVGAMRGVHFKLSMGLCSWNARSHSTKYATLDGKRMYQTAT